MRRLVLTLGLVLLLSLAACGRTTVLTSSHTGMVVSDGFQITLSNWTLTVACSPAGNSIMLTVESLNEVLVFPQTFVPCDRKPYRFRGTGIGRFALSAIAQVGSPATVHVVVTEP
jgi:hypothetical protein